jgi:hypothetical protein
MRGDRSTIRAIRGPIILITVGVLFALQSFNIYGFDQTWPVLLIVIGLLSLCGRALPAQPGSGSNHGVPPPPNYNWPPPSGGYRGTSYAQSPYAQPGTPSQAGVQPDAAASGPAKGGFGSSAPTGGGAPNPPAGANPGGSL